MDYQVGFLALQLLCKIACADRVRRVQNSRALLHILLLDCCPAFLLVLVRMW